MRKLGELKPDLTTTEHFVIRLSYLSSYLQRLLDAVLDLLGSFLQLHGAQLGNNSLCLQPGGRKTVK